MAVAGIEAPKRVKWMYYTVQQFKAQYLRQTSPKQSITGVYS